MGMAFLRQKIVNPTEIRSWRTTPSHLSVTAYLIYSKLHSDDQIKESGFGGYCRPNGEKFVLQQSTRHET